MKEITASVTGQNLVLDQTVLNVAGTVNLYKLKITFDADWETADTKIVSFSNGCGKAIAVEYNDDNGVTIPWEALQTPEGQIGKVHIGVLGYAGTTLRITTTSAYEANVLIVMPASLGLEAAMTPTPDIYQKLLQAIAAEDSKMGQLTNLDTDDKSNLVAAINEVLSKIEQGGGTVKSVNNIEPDDNGNITLPIPNKTSQLTNDSNFQNGTQTAATANAAVATHNTSNIAHADIREALSGKQAALSTDQMKAVNSGIDSTKVGQIATNTTNIASNSGEIATINGKIPAQATSSNQLADKNFVNSTVQTASANFRGNWATWNAVPSDANDYPADADGNKTPTKNDYMVVQDASGYPTSPDPALAGTWRFKYTGTWATDGKNGWHPEYQVNETALTEAQLAALNSGITTEAVTKLGGIESGAEVNDIDSISVNGTAVTPDANKNVALTIPEGAKALTTEDYDYNSSGMTDDGVALWRLPDGLYSAGAGVKCYPYASNQPFVGSPIISVRTNAINNTLKDICWAGNAIVTGDAGWAAQASVISSSGLLQSTGKDYNRVGNVYQVLTRRSIVDDLISDTEAINYSAYYRHTPLSAYQGKVLNDKIEGRLKTNAGAPTTSTTGTKGQLLEDTTNGNLYICTNSASPYAWKQIDKDEILTNAGAPTTSTAGTLGQLLTDTTNAKLYQLTAIDNTDPQNPSYTWSEIGGGSGPTVVQTTGTSTTDVMSQGASHALIYADQWSGTSWTQSSSKIRIGQNFGSASTAQGGYSVMIGFNGSANGQFGVHIGSGGGTTAGQNALGFQGGKADAVYSVAFDGGQTSGASQQGVFQIGLNQGYASTHGYNNSAYRLLTGLYDPQAAHDAATKGYVDGTTETLTIADTDWSALSSSDPYTYSATVSVTATIGANSTVELINDAAVDFATYGFAIGAVDTANNTVTFYSIGAPSASKTLKVNVKG